MELLHPDHLQDGLWAIPAWAVEHGESRYLRQRMGGAMDTIRINHLHLADGETRDGIDDELRYRVLGPDCLLCDDLLVY